LERWKIDLGQAEERRRLLQAEAPSLIPKLRALFSQQPLPRARDVDEALYDGFLPDSDMRIARQIQSMRPLELQGWDPGLTDPRLREMFFRYRARSWPESLTAAEQERWHSFCQDRILHGPGLTLSEFQEELQELRRLKRSPAILDAVAEWVFGQQLPKLGISAL
jgi:exodeoxyribonuclease-1